jgi:TatD DNase family protein
MKFVDSHAHINSEEFQDDREQVISKAFRQDIESILCPIELTEPKNLHIALELVERHAKIFAAAGVHPHNAKDFHPEMASTLRRLVSENKIQAVGEIGLDFHYNLSSPEEQKKALRSQLNLAQDLGLPVVIHSRNAADEIAAAIEKEGFSNGGVLHCFTENWEFAEHMLKQNFLISFSGILTYPNAQSLRDVAKKLPLAKTLIETDSPYLTPVPYRGRVRRNEPVYVKEVAKKLAAIKNVDLEEVARVTSQNFASVFPIEK